MIAVSVADFGATGDQHFALRDWFAEQVASDLRHAADDLDALVVFREHQLNSTQYIGLGPKLVPISDVDACVFGFLSPVPGGIRVRLVGILLPPVHADSSWPAFVVRDIPVTGAMEPWIPKEWRSLQDNDEVQFALPPDSDKEPVASAECECCLNGKYKSNYEDSKKSKWREFPGRTGIVVLLATIGTDGNPYDVQVAGSAGHDLDQRAVGEVTGWRGQHRQPETLALRPRGEVREPSALVEMIDVTTTFTDSNRLW